MSVIHRALPFRVPDVQGMAYQDTPKAHGVDARLVWFADENHWVLIPRNRQLWSGEFFVGLKRHAAGAARSKPRRQASQNPRIKAVGFGHAALRYCAAGARPLRSRRVDELNHITGGPMRSFALPAAITTAVLCSATAVHALEPFKLYDRFADRPLDPARWAEGERVREIRGAGVLRLMQRSWGLGGSDAGLHFQSWGSSVSNPDTVTALRARINVTALETHACPSNPALAQARARIGGTFFNTGTPTPGSMLGDAFAQVRLTRFSNSADPQDVLRVQGILSICTSADCNLATTVGNVVDLGTVTIGTPTVVQMQWDQGGKTFYFSRDNGAFSGTVAYTQSDTAAPGNPFKHLSTRVDLPNCQSAPPVSALVDAKFDNVQVNQSTVP